MLSVMKDGNYKIPRPKKLVKAARLERYYPQRLVIKQKKHIEVKGDNGNDKNSRGLCKGN